MNLHRSTDPSSWLAVTRSDMEAQLAIGADYESSRTDSIIAAASQWVQDYTQRSILRGSQAYTLTLEKWPSKGGAISIPKGPVYQGGTFTLHYINSAGVSTELTIDTDFKLNGEETSIPYLTPTSGGWPSLYSSDDRDVITLVYTVGPASVPAWAAEAVKAYGTYLYEKDPGYLKIAESLCRSHKIHFDWKLND